MLRKIYDTSPEFVKQVVRGVRNKIVPFPCVMGKGFAKAYNELMEGQWYSKEYVDGICLSKQ